jgi:hypothetical protein
LSFGEAQECVAFADGTVLLQILAAVARTVHQRVRPDARIGHTVTNMPKGIGIVDG